MRSLLPQWISKANVKQRAGRAGRLQPGVCYHVYTRDQYQQVEPFRFCRLTKNVIFFLSSPPLNSLYSS